MNKTTPDKSLHFIVRHDGYEQTLGYGHFLNHVLQELNVKKPKTARALIEDTAMLMLNPLGSKYVTDKADEQEKNPQIWLDCLPEEVRKENGLSTQSFATGAKGAANAQFYFGPAAGPAFGLLQHRSIDWQSKHRRAYAQNISTDILLRENREDACYRGYYEAFQRNCNPSNVDIGAPMKETFQLSFSYDYKSGFLGKKKTLPLMKIGSPMNLIVDFKDNCKGDIGIAMDYLWLPFAARNARLIFLHPKGDKANFDALCEALTPLLKTIDAKPKSRVQAGDSPPEEKLDAVATIYWLVAQSTPVVRGGSGMANVILEHVAERLRQQGYDYELPYTKEGTDLWAEAATLPLEDQKHYQGVESFSGFKTRFKEGAFFDKSVTDEQVKQYVEHAIERQTAVDVGDAHFTNLALQEKVSASSLGK
ncbi:MAG: hypothetical protein SFT92_05530 [Rickettsiales bacterium]|nr:hypothetical protein [Rickettsiales bacterium]